MCFVALFTVGCSTIFDGKYQTTTEDLAVEYVKDTEVISVENSAIEVKIYADFYGEKVDAKFTTVYTGNGIKAIGETEIYDIKVNFYYLEGYLYSKSSLAGDSTKIKEKMDLEEAIFGGNVNYVHELVSSVTMFDAETMAKYFINVEGTTYFIESGSEYDKLKIQHIYEFEYEEIKSKLTTTTTICYVFDKAGRYVTSKISIKSVRISRGQKEKSLIECTVKRFTGDIELPSNEELATYKPI